MEVVTKMSTFAFWSKVDMSGGEKACWPWTGARKPVGYGNVRINKKDLLAHRVAFQMANGGIPEGFLVCHVCDHPPCCNPDHLMLGTAKSNAADMMAKHRGRKPEFAARGTGNGNSKLNDAKVVQIREIYKSKEMNQYQLADAFGVTQAAIGSVLRNKTWRHVK